MFSGIVVENRVFRKIGIIEHTLFLPVFWLLPDFFQINNFGFNSISALAVGPFLWDFRPKRVFPKCRPSQKKLDFACVLALPDFFFKLRFSTLAPFWGSPSGRFFVDFRPKRAFPKFRTSQKKLDFACVLALPDFFFKLRFSTLAPFWGSPSGRFFWEFR